ncbi:M48 family metallopeptidase [Streptomyces sp. NPDC088097]|uniref:M48 family metallopeptidase n=1 Tax=Streptomyces sp. NPDC088097 TaxID=3365823 RepID=UPI00381990AC
MEKTEVTTAPEATRPCPECGSAVPVAERYVDWCAECGWNVDPAAPDPAPGRLAAARRRLVQELGEQLASEVEEAAAGGARPDRDPAAVLAFGLALLVHAVTLLLVVGGLALVLLGWDTGVQPVIGALLLGLAAALRPRPVRLPKDGQVLHRADAPHLFELVDEVAGAVGTTGVHTVLVNAEYNASVTTYGVRRRRVLTIGLPFWEVLTPQERVALLGHELGHFAHGDIRYGRITGGALHALAVWHYVLAPTPAERLLDRFVNAVTFLPRWVAYGLLLLLDRLTLRASQRAEYLADASAVRAASPGAAVGLMDRLLVGDAVEAELRRQSVVARMGGGRTGREVREAAEAGLWERLAARVAAVPEREYERLRRVSALRGHSVDHTHPPTHARRRHMAAGAPVAALVSCDDARAAAVAAELAPSREALARLVIREYAG